MNERLILTENLENFSSKSIYPNRPSFGLESKVEELKKIEMGKGEMIKLSEEEKEKLFSFEESLAEELESFYPLGMFTTDVYVYPGYFLSEEGKEMGKDVLGLDFSDCHTEEEVLRRIFVNKKIFPQKRLGEIKKIFNRSESYTENVLFNQLILKIDENGSLQETLEGAPMRKEIILNEDDLKKKNDLARNFKKKLKTLYREFQLREDKKILTNLEIAQKTIIEIYLKRTNQTIAELQPKMYSLLAEKVLFEKNKDNKEFGEEYSKDNNREVGRRERNVGRYDKFIFGVEQSFTNQGEKQQIGNILRDYANMMEGDYIQEALFREEKLKRMGLDGKKVFEKNLQEDSFRKMVEEILDFYNQRSEYPSSDYDPTRNGPAPDNKWQFVTDPNRNSMAVDSDKQIIISGTKDKSIYEVISVLLGHEIEGHFIQALNKKKVPLKIFEKARGDRTEIFAEGGAMLVQDIISRKAFGLGVMPSSHYIRAMEKRLEGGSYLDCVRTFYQSAIKICQIKRSLGKIDEISFKDEIKKNLMLAINRTSRLFRGGTDLNSREAVLSRSKDTVYLEQKKLLDQLKEAGLEKYAFVGGMNIDTVISLIKIGVLKPEEIVAPDYFSLKIWERVKSNYEL